MQQSIARNDLLSAVIDALSEAPVVALLGARQVGKTTLAGQVVNAWPGTSTLYDLEVAAVREALSATPERLLRNADGLVVIDEVQRMPALFEVLRPVCDDPNRQAVFLLLGSASWELIKGVSETLAGRILFVDVGGLSLRDLGTEHQDRLWMRGGFPRAWLAGGLIKGVSETLAGRILFVDVGGLSLRDLGTEHQDRLWMRGGFPRAWLARSPGAWTRWMQSFTRTFLERDIPALGVRTAPEALARFWKMLAHYHGQTWNASELARSMDVSVTAVTRYRDLLAGTFMIRVLPPWFVNSGKRTVKSPRVFLRDSGILHFLLGLEEMAEVAMHPRYGASWEGFALEQTLLAHGEHEAYFYGTQRGAELDLMLLRRGRRWGFEFKCTDAPRTTKSMHIVVDDLGLERLWVVYPGDLEYPLTETITALPLKKISDIALRASK